MPIVCWYVCALPHHGTQNHSSVPLHAIAPCHNKDTLHVIIETDLSMHYQRYMYVKQIHVYIQATLVHVPTIYMYQETCPTTNINWQIAEKINTRFTVLKSEWCSFSNHNCVLFIKRMPIFGRCTIISYQTFNA